MRRAVRNLGYVLTSDVLSRVAGFVVTAWLAQHLGVDNFGAIGFALAALSYGLIVTDLGLLKLGTREVAQNRAHAEAYVAGISALRLVLAVIALAGLGVFAVLLPKPVSVKLLVLSYGLALFPNALLLDWLFQGIERMGQIAISRIVLSGSYLVAVLIWVRTPEHLLRVPFLWLAGNLLAVGYLLAVYGMKVGRWGLSFSLRFWGLLLQVGLPLAAGTILSQVYVNFGLILMGLIAAASATGCYAAAFRLVYFVLLIDRLFYTVAFPVIARHLRKGAVAARAVIDRLTRLLLAVVVPVAFCGTALAHPLIQLVFGEQFQSAAVVFKVLVWLAVTTTLNSLYAYGLIGAGQEKKYARNITIGTIAVIAFSVPLVLAAGAMGAAVGLVAGETVMLGLMIADFRRILPVSLLRHATRPVIIAALFAAGLRWLSPHLVSFVPLVGAVILTIAFYVGIMYLVGGIGRTDFELLSQHDDHPA